MTQLEAIDKAIAIWERNLAIMKAHTKEAYTWNRWTQVAEWPDGATVDMSTDIDPVCNYHRFECVACILRRLGMGCNDTDCAAYRLRSLIVSSEKVGRNHLRLTRGVLRTLREARKAVGE